MWLCGIFLRILEYENPIATMLPVQKIFLYFFSKWTQYHYFIMATYCVNVKTIGLIKNKENLVIMKSACVYRLCMCTCVCELCVLCMNDHNWPFYGERLRREKSYEYAIVVVIFLRIFCGYSVLDKLRSFCVCFY